VNAAGDSIVQVRPTAAGPAESGYASSAYAHSLSDFGEPLFLARSGGWLLVRKLDEHPDFSDAMGCYPIFSCPRWSALETDVEELGVRLISIALVTDPFGAFDPEVLSHCFPDRFIPFKQHFVADLDLLPERFVSRHHRYYAKQALKAVEVEWCERPEDHLEDWLRLYAVLVDRHQLTGIKAFSRRAFKEQLEVPGLVMLRAIADGETVAAHLWFRQGDVVHSHLAASNAHGYRLMAPYAIYWTALETFRPHARWINFGAGAGIGASEQSGLARFKKGWSTGTRASFLCGRVLDRVRYEEVVGRSGHGQDDYFPAYRRGEFA
jgi:hypothetical protein